MINNQCIEKLERIRSSRFLQMSKEDVETIQSIINRPDLECHNCLNHTFSLQAGVPETYTYERECRYTWSVPNATECIKKYNIKSMPIDNALAWQFLDGHDISVDHMLHLPEDIINKPGIAVRLRTPPHHSVLIDGSHRFARALHDNKQIKIYALDLNLSNKCLMSDLEVQKHQQQIQSYMSRMIR